VAGFGLFGVGFFGIEGVVTKPARSLGCAIDDIDATLAQVCGGFRGLGARRLRGRGGLRGDILRRGGCFIGDILGDVTRLVGDVLATSLVFAATPFAVSAITPGAAFAAASALSRMTGACCFA